MRKLLLFSLGLLFLAACRKDIMDKPENLIPRKKMVDIMYDMAVLSATKSVQQDILIENNIFPETYLYEKYQIDSLQLVESKVYYASRPDVYLKIFKEVEGRLNAQKEAMEKEQALQDEESDMDKNNSEKKSDSILSIKELGKGKRDTLITQE
ncbi:DUF4296 domain-containing protein [Imtechella halotolerans]|nr:DUF4296 domain-containing protein [Imtechella halotolerans]WMQ62664.1 DUF4296 domain-containing protein [Imtechella halotolerans]